MDHSPYLDRPLRTIEQARADIAAARKIEREAEERNRKGETK